MPYAANGQISSDFFEGSIPITQEEYSLAMNGMLNGLAITIGPDGKLLLIDPNAEPEVPPPSQEEQDEAAYLAWKVARAEAVQAILVTVDGMVFEGDEVSQGRMSRAIIGLQNSAPGTLIRWVLANNNAVNVNVTQLTQALTLAGLRQAELWVKA